MPITDPVRFPCCVSAAVACGLLAVPGPAAARALSVPDAALVDAGGAERAAVRPHDLAAVRRLFLALSREVSTEGERIAASADLSVLAEAVLGGALPEGVTLDELARAAGRRMRARDAVPAGVAARDAAAYRLLALGYSAREAADVVSGRVTQQGLDVARRMIAVGRGQATAARYLDEQYALARAWRTAPADALTARAPVRDGAFDAAIDHYARVHDVDAAVVRAIIEVESAFDPAAVSRAGAIGLMQLMPATARELGVDPLVPEENIEGGVRYFSELLETFGGVELALVAYNAGPGFARRYARGQIPLYGETRDYVSKVLARLGAPRRPALIAPAGRTASPAARIRPAR